MSATTLRRPLVLRALVPRPVTVVVLPVVVPVLLPALLLMALLVVTTDLALAMALELLLPPQLPLSRPSPLLNPQLPLVALPEVSSSLFLSPPRLPLPPLLLQPLPTMVVPTAAP